MRPSEGRLRLWPLFILAIVLVILGLSVNSVYRLDSKAPNSFLIVPAVNGKPDRGLARAYWQVAVSTMQWKFPRGTALPQKPPVDFALPIEDSPAWRDNGGARLAYWSELRRLWERPELWNNRFEIDVSWTGRAYRAVSGGISSLLQKST